jgi:hypothetical protein
MTAKEQWVNCLVQEQKDRYFTLSARGFDVATFQVSSPNTLTTRLPDAVFSVSARVGLTILCVVSSLRGELVTLCPIGELWLWGDGRSPSLCGHPAS